MSRFSCLFLVAMVGFASACSSVHKRADYMNTPEYQSRQKLVGALSVGENGLTEESIGKLLSSRIEIPQKVNIAVFRMGNQYRAFDFRPLDEEVAEEFYDHKKWGNRVLSVMPVPSVIAPDQMDMKSMRDVAALLQADLFLVLVPKTRKDWQFKMLDENEVKAMTQFEVLMVDTKTGAIPFTFVASKTARVIKNDKDYSNDELMERAKFLSEKKAYLDLQPKVATFLSRLR